MTISATLTQFKAHVEAWTPTNPNPGDGRAYSAHPARFVVRTDVSLPTLPKIAAPLVIAFSIPDIDQEHFVQVATPEQLNTLPVNPITRFSDDTVNFGTVPFQSAPLYLEPIPELDLGGDPEPHYVTGVDGRRLVMDAPFWYIPVMPLRWTWGELSGVMGRVQRVDIELDLWLDSQFMAMFAEAQEGLDHMTSVQANFQSLLSALAMTPSEYQAYPPGSTNPQVHTYTG